MIITLSSRTLLSGINYVAQTIPYSIFILLYPIMIIGSPLEVTPLSTLLWLYSSLQTKHISAATCLSLMTLLCVDDERKIALVLT